MALHRSFAAASASGGAGGCVLAVGNFDGVHRGHHSLLAVARRRADAQDRPLCALCFDPHPQLFFHPESPPRSLTPTPLKARLLRACGVDVVVAAPFNAEIAALSPDRFVAEIAVGRLGAGHVVVGEDFRFGAGRRGDVNALKAIGGTLGIGVDAVPLLADSEAYSSSRIRRALEDGDAAGAARLLGRFWAFEGVVESGDRRGRELGFPTANLRPDDDLLRPRFGVYAVRAMRLDGDDSDPLALPPRQGVANWGLRPTVASLDPPQRCEIHMIDYDGGNLYGARLRVALIDFLRPERKFASLDDLKAQIARDRQAALSRLERNDDSSHPSPPEPFEPS